MANMNKSLHELHSLLVQAEKDMGVSGSTRKDVIDINVKGKRKFKRDVGKKPVQVEGKGKAIANSSTKPKLKKGNPFKDTCNYCINKGHWKRNCPKYLDDIKAGIGLKSVKKLSKGEVDLRMGNGSKVAAGRNICT
ncbi:uncharacterized protein LOC141617882 [Silene latifolia]|uniref:uncharacterized protein LOC141617882 n=1 Tax=Silene latifolia TaxID=37657 RepID=UPI003D77F35F